MSTRGALVSGARDALGVPAGVLAAGFLGFGALAGAAGSSIWLTIASTLTIWALPGQLALLEMWQIGAPMIAVVLAVMLINARFLPMVMTLMPMLRDSRHPPWRFYLAAHLIAMTSWAVCMRRCPEMPGPERVIYVTGFGLACIAASAVTATVGSLIAGSIPHTVQLGLVFLSPLYFFLILIVDARDKLTGVALTCGALAGPLCHLLTPQWGVLLAGVAGGTLAFVVHKSLERNRA